MQTLKRATAAFAAATFLLLGIGTAVAAGPGAAAKAVSAHNYTAVWWKAPASSESGWGINFSHQGDIVFATWFTYDSNRQPQWFIAQLDKSSERAYSGPVSRVTGPPFNTEPFPGNTAVETAVGTATVTFSEDGESAGFAYTVNGVSQTKTIVRQLFAEPVPTCVWNELILTAATNYQGLWWALGGTESGWGINFTHQGKVIFATWFTYDLAGKPWWLVVLADRTGPRTYSGPVSTVSGPAFDADPWDPTTVGETNVGQATITFTDGNRATLQYTVNGVTQTKQIERQVFAGGGTVCAVPDQSAAYVASFVDLANRANAGTINDDQFATELQALLATIDGTDGALQRLKDHLGPSVVGRAIDFPIPAAAGHGAGTKALTVQFWDAIFASPAFQLLQAAVASTTFLATPDAQGNFIVAEDIATLVALASIVVRSDILDALTAGAISGASATQDLGLVPSNAYEALRRLHLQLGLAIPAWLQPAPTTCLTNCVDVNRRYSGDGTGQAQLQLNVPLSCKALVGYTGSFNVDLIIHPNNTVDGTVAVVGTARVLQIIADPGNSPFCATLVNAQVPVNTTAPITGTVNQMTAAINVAGLPGLLIIGQLNGDTLLGQVQTVTGTVLLNFALTRLP
jgi:hypothetical protein